MGRFIFAGIVTLILLLLLCSVTVLFEYGGGEYSLRVKYLCFTLFRLPARKKRKRAKQKAGDKAAQETSIGGEVKSGQTAAPETGGQAVNEHSEEPQTETSDTPKKNAAESEKSEKAQQKEKASLGDLYEIARLVLDSLGKPLRKLLKRSVIDRLCLKIVCGGEDAAKAALNFGKTNILVGNALGWLGSFFTLKPPENLKVDVDFYSEDTTAEASLRLRLSVLTALAFVFTLLGRAVRYYTKNPKAAAAVGRLRK